MNIQRARSRHSGSGRGDDGSANRLRCRLDRGPEFVERFDQQIVRIGKDFSAALRPVAQCAHVDDRPGLDALARQACKRPTVWGRIRS